MSISPVSGVSFRANEVDTTNLLERPGKYSLPEAAKDEFLAPEGEKKKSSWGKKLLKTLGVAAVIAAGLVALKKFDVVKILNPEALKEAKFLQKLGHYVAKAGDVIAKYTYEPLIALFKKAPKVAEEATTAVTEVAAK